MSYAVLAPSPRCAVTTLRRTSSSAESFSGVRKTPSFSPESLVQRPARACGRVQHLERADEHRPRDAGAGHDDARERRGRAFAPRGVKERLAQTERHGVDEGAYGEPRRSAVTLDARAHGSPERRVLGRRWGPARQHLRSEQRRGWLDHFELRRSGCALGVEGHRSDELTVGVGVRGEAVEPARADVEHVRVRDVAGVVGPGRRAVVVELSLLRERRPTARR